MIFPSKEKTASGLNGGSSARVVEWIVAGTITVLTAYLSFRLRGAGLSTDEATSFFIAHLDAGRMWTSFATSEANSSLFYVTLSAWKAFGESESALRILPALFAVATIPLLFAYVQRGFGLWIAAIASILVGTNPFFIAYAHTLRGYSLSALLAVVSTLLLDRAVSEPRARRWGVYSLVGGLSLYAHFFCAFVILAHILSFGFLGRKLVPWRQLFASYVGMAFLASPLAYFIFFNDVGQVDWIPRPSPRRMSTVLHDLVGFGDDVVLWIYAALVVLGFVGLGYELYRAGRTHESWRMALLGMWLILPIVLSYWLSYVKPLFLSRYLLVAVPALAACAAIGLRTLRFRGLWVAGAAILVFLGSQSLRKGYHELPNGVWRARAERIVNNTQPGDGAVYYSPTVIRPYGYYGGYYSSEISGTERLPTPIYPNLHWLGYSATRFEPDFPRLARMVAARERIWLLTGHFGSPPRRRELRRMRSMLERVCEPSQKTFSGAAITLFVDCGRH